MAWRGLQLGILVALAGFAGPGRSAAQAPGATEFGADRLADPPPPTQPAGATLGRPAATPVYTLDDFVRLGLERHPRLAQAGFAVEAARGRAVQAGLYPNPVVSANFDELGDRQGRGGVNTIPLISQEIVTGGKLGLGRAAADREVDQAALALAARRAELMAGIRAAYFDLLTLRRRVELLRAVRDLTEQSVARTRALVAAKQAPELDVYQLEVDAERARAAFEAAEQELPAAFRRLAAAAGARDLEAAPLAGSLDDPLPDYDLDRLRAHVLAVHPDVRSAQVGLERARLVWQRAQAEVIPNVTVSGGYVRQNQNKSDDAVVGVSLPVPVWNRNQGNIRAAMAEVGSAAREVERVENDLTERVAVAFREYAAARRQAERLAGVRDKAEQAFRLVADPKNLNVTAIQRLVAQQAVAQARLEYARARGDAWRAASALSGLTLEEPWPPVPVKAPDPAPGSNP